MAKGQSTRLISQSQGYWVSNSSLDLLPQLTQFLEKIDEKRQSLIDQLFNALDDLRDSLCKGEDVCSYECSSMLLGSLMKEMHKIRHISSPVTRPYNGYSVAGLMQRMSDFRLPMWYGLKDLSPKGRNMHCCNLAKKIQPIVSDVEKKITEFRLEDF